MNEKILIVDDQAAFLSLFQAYLGAKGYELLTASDGVSALEVLRREKIAVILADQQMPEMKGHELLAKARAESPETIRVLITGYSEIEAVIAAVNEGALHRYIAKNSLPEEIALVVDQCLEKYRQEQDIQKLYRSNRRLLRLLAAEKHLSAMGLFGKELSQKLEEIVMGFSGYLFQEAGQSNAGELARKFGFLEAALRKIRELSLMANGDFEGKESVDINHLVAEETRKRKGRPRLDLDNTLPSLPGDDAGLRRLLKELIENAVDHGSEGAVSIRTRYYADSEDPRIQIDVQNDCEGKQDVALFFAPFYTTRNFEDSHLGLGLPIAQWIAHRHGGEIELRRTDRRLTASVTLPIP